jgi:hypothetical protein
MNIRGEFEAAEAGAVVSVLEVGVQTGSGAHPASYRLGTGGSFPRGKARPGRCADCSPLSSAGVKKE